nr:MAG TPA: hypothetical protein [Caudoviricetes sp.]
MSVLVYCFGGEGKASVVSSFCLCAGVVFLSNHKHVP